MYASSDFERSLLMKALAETFSRIFKFIYLFLLHIEIELMSIYVYICLVKSNLESDGINQGDVEND